MNNFNFDIEENSAEDSQPWLMTFADMMTLLFAFFVLLYSMSSPDPVKMAGIQDAMAVKAGYEGEIKPLNEIKEAVEDIVENMDLQDVANVINDPRGVALELDGDICFGSTSTEIRQNLVTILDKVAAELLSIPGDPRMVIVEGHTDSAPIPKSLEKYYPTNWELSAARASVVVNYLINQGVNSGKLQASGYADRWPADITWFEVRSGEVNDVVIAENNKTKQQMDKNRRIKIVFTNN